jgi:hypothetical protein
MAGNIQDYDGFTKTIVGKTILQRHVSGKPIPERVTLRVRNW